MAQCWERRGCDEEMMSRCPHNIPGEPCPADCRFAACTRSTHEVCQDFNKLLNPFSIEVGIVYHDAFLRHNNHIYLVRIPFIRVTIKASVQSFQQSHMMKTGLFQNSIHTCPSFVLL